MTRLPNNFVQTSFKSIALVICSLVVFGWAFHNPFYFDDIVAIQDNAWLNGSLPPLGWFQTFFFDSNHIFIGYRPILMLSYFFNVEWLGNTPSAIRTVNIALHTFNSLLVVLFFFQLLQNNSYRNILSWGTGFLFLLHPVQTLGINFLWKRSSMLAAMFLLLGLCFHVYERQKKQTYLFSMVMIQWLIFVLALLSKEVGIIYPWLVMSVDLLFFRERRVLLHRNSWFLYLGYFCIGLFFVWFRLYYMNLMVPVAPALNRRLVEHQNYLWGSFKVIPEYVWLWLFPNPLIMEDPLPVFVFPWSSFLICLGLLSFSVFMVFRYRSFPCVSFSIALFWLGLAPTIGPTPILFVKDQIRLYIPLIGLSFLMAYGSHRLFCVWRPKASSVLVIVAISVCYGAFSIFQNIRYASPLLIWEDVLVKYPKSGLAWEYLGTVLDSQRQHYAAAKAFEQADRVEPENHAYRIKAIHSMFLAGEPRAELKKKLLEVSSDKVDALQNVNLAILHAELEDYASALKKLQHTIEVYPNYSLAHYTLGVVWERMKKWDDAKRAYLNTLILMPNDHNAHDGLERVQNRGHFSNQQTQQNKNN